MQRCELAIVGGGPAGLATALFLAHARPELTERILVLEKESYPRDKICGGAIGARADRLLESIGVRVEVPSAQIAALSVRIHEGEICERLDHIGRVVRRLEYDRALFEVARGRGIRVQEGARVTGLEVDAGGVSLHGAPSTLRASAVVGADGVGSVVRRALGLPAGRLRAQVIEVDTEEVPVDRPRDVLHFDLADRTLTGYAWDFPTLVDGRPLWCRGVYHLKLDERSVDIAALLERRLTAIGLSLSDCRIKRFAERGFEPHLPYAQPRVALVGEAAGIDALSGEGIAQAIEYGAFAGPYLAEKIAAGDFRFQDWSARFGRSRVGFDLRLRERLLPYYFGSQRARIERHLVMMPELVVCTMQQFAGLPVDNLGFARGLANGAVRALGDKLRGRRRSRPG